MLALLCATLLVHGWSIGDGLLLDDHWHMRQMADRTWSLTSLLESTTIEPARFIDSWWQDEPVRWQYARPVAVALAKLVYHFTDGSVKALHVVSVLLHLAGALLIYTLAMMLTRRRFWSLIAGLTFVVYSHTVITVAWLAAQNAILQTVLTLAALVCYVRASKLSLCEMAPEAGDNDPDSAMAASAKQLESGRDSDDVPRLSNRWLTLALLAWLLALGARENAVVFIVFMVSFDWAFGGRVWLRARWHVYALVALLTCVFVFWRLYLFYEPMPDFYVRRADGLEYVIWWIVKLMHYLTSILWLSPMTVGPSGRYNPVAEVPGDCLLMLGILAVLITGYVQSARSLRGWWIWPLWILLSILPVVPLMATPHSGYMPAVGFALGLAVPAALRHRVNPRGLGRLIHIAAIAFPIAMLSYYPFYRTMWISFLAAERATVRAVEIDPPPAEAKLLFFVNLPFVNVYLKPHLREKPYDSARKHFEATIGENVRVHALTYAPDVLRMDRACVVEQVDERTIIVSTEGRGYFSGALGRFFIEGMRNGQRLQQGDHVDPENGLFDVEILEADDQGVTRIRFRFEQSLSDRRYCFYVATRAAPAVRLRFDQGDQQPTRSASEIETLSIETLLTASQRLQGGDASAAEVLFSGAKSSDGAIQEVSAGLLIAEIEPILSALASPVSFLAQGDTRLSTEKISQAQQWWRRYASDEQIEALHAISTRLGPLIEAREKLYKIRQHFADHLLATDLYLTGPPFPGPR